MGKAVIFDMDGVIIDSEPIHFASDKMTMLDFGCTITDTELNQYVGVANPVMWAELRRKYNMEATIEELLQKQMYYKKLLFGEQSLKSIEGIGDLLKTLKDLQFKIGLASSSPREFIELILNSLGIVEYFDTIVSGEDVKRSKPAPDIFLKTAQALNVHPSDCLVIEDSSHGVKAAKEAGMRCIGFLNPNSGDQDLSSSDVQVYSIKEIDQQMIR